MNRRDLLVGGVGVGLAAVAQVACADSKPQPKQPGPVSGDPRAALLAALEHCIGKAQACAAHCHEQLATGNKEFAHCASAVADTLAVAWALQGLVSRKSVSAKKLAEACAAICRECSAACAEHKEHFAHGMHLECKECGESCDACVAACAAFIA